MKKHSFTIPLHARGDNMSTDTAQNEVNELKKLLTPHLLIPEFKEGWEKVDGDFYQTDSYDDDPTHYPCNVYRSRSEPFGGLVFEREKRDFGNFSSLGLLRGVHYFGAYLSNSSAEEITFDEYQYNHVCVTYYNGKIILISNYRHNRTYGCLVENYRAPYTSDLANFLLHIYNDDIDAFNKLKEFVLNLQDQS